MRKILNYVLIFALLVSCFTLFAACNDNGTEAEKKDPGFTYELVTGENEEDSYLKVTGYNVTDEVADLVSKQNFASEKVQAVSKIEIPSEKVEYKRNGTVVGTYPVKEIAESAFSNMLFIKEIVIPANVETIGNACLAGCTRLEKVTVPFVGNKATGNVNSKKTFAYLFGVSEATGATSSTIKYNATGSFTCYIPDSLKTIVLTGNTVSDYAFYGLSKVEEIVLPDTVTEYGAYAFSNCSSLYKFTVGTAVTKIGEGAFNACTSFVSAGLNDATALEYIGNSAFNGCSLLFYSVDNGSYNLTANITYVGEKAFAGCTSLKTANLTALSGKTATIKQSAFSGCTGLTKVMLPTDNANITYGNLVFTGCTELKKEGVTNYTNLHIFDFDYEA